MGIKHLWSLLEPFAERKPLCELSGQVVCVDLSGWVCESMNITDYKIQPKMYLKHLFFRTSYLLLANITPIFIAEGETPELKFQVIAKRNEIQFMGARPRAAPSETKKDPKGRTRFNHTLKQCEELISCLGVQTLQPPGEAEAYGAHLNALGLIDGVISQDSDCFAYGARRVYRNFSVAQASGAMVDVYDMQKIDESGNLDMGQNKVIAMGLLCGCDYSPEGVHGVGRDGVLRLINQYTNEEILNAIQGWRIEKSKFDVMERKALDTSRCNTCGHLGKQVSHTRKGCVDCGTRQGCQETPWKEERLSMKNELQIREKALKDKDFPSTQIIHEFKKRLDVPKTFDKAWRQPNIVKFVKVMGRQLEWREIYAFQKVFPLLTRWQLEQGDAALFSRSQRGFVVPQCIKKKRNPKAIPCYEVLWKDEHKYFSEIFPDEQMQDFLLENENNLDSLWTTIEPAVLVDRVYPQLVAAFEEEKLAKKKQKPKAKRAAAKSPTTKKTKPKRSKPSESLNDFSAMQTELDAIPVKKKVAKKPAGIEKFLRVQSKKPAAADDSLMALAHFSDDDGDLENIQDLSNLISDIVSRSPTVKRLQGHDLVYAEFKGEEVPPPDEQTEKNQSLDDIDLMIMRRKPNPHHKRVESLRTALLSSTPNSRGNPLKNSSCDKAGESSFFSAATEYDIFESSYNAMISHPGREEDLDESSDEL